MMTKTENTLRQTAGVAVVLVVSAAGGPAGYRRPDGRVAGVGFTGVRPVGAWPVVGAIGAGRIGVRSAVVG
jgi:hypothetical protein